MISEVMVGSGIVNAVGITCSNAGTYMHACATKQYNINSNLTVANKYSFHCTRIKIILMHSILSTL